MNASDHESHEMLTFGQMSTIRHNLLDVESLLLRIGGEFLGPSDLHMRAHIVGAKSNVDTQVFVSENLFLVPKERVCELGVEYGYRSKSIRRRSDKIDSDGIVRLA